jgi:hypothetical protein
MVFMSGGLELERDLLLEIEGGRAGHGAGHGEVAAV